MVQKRLPGFMERRQGAPKGEPNPLKPDAIQEFMNPSIMGGRGGMYPFKENKSPGKQSGECNNSLRGNGCIGHQRNSEKGSEGARVHCLI